ncbi:MAG: hypothetical protein LJU34_03355 [Oscillospiraceae bacterium]|nr:hypothetical protein [Oscillospiraceae bacterium]
MTGKKRAVIVIVVVLVLAVVGCAVFFAARGADAGAASAGESTVSPDYEAAQADAETDGADSADTEPSGAEETDDAAEAADEVTEPEAAVVEAVEPVIGGEIAVLEDDDDVVVTEAYRAFPEADVSLPIVP